MNGIAGDLLDELRKTLRKNTVFQSDSELKGVFVDARLSPWRFVIPGANNETQRANAFIAKFYDTKTRDGISVLVLFLQVLHEQYAIERDEEYAKLGDLAIRTGYALNRKLPPIASNNVWRAEAAITGATEPDKKEEDYTRPSAEPDHEAHPSSLMPPNLTVDVFDESLESLKNPAKAYWLSRAFLKDGSRATSSVGRVEHRGYKYGTAFLVAPDLVLTNEHVANKLPDLTKAGVRFDVDLGVDAQWYSFTERVTGSPVADLDFALLRLNRRVKSAPLRLSNEPAYSDQHANILQFPGKAGDNDTDGLMKVAIRYNAVVHVEDERFYYVTDTEKGSSGSPVFDDDWRVIGLHRAGMVDSNNRPVKNANEGVPILAIEPYIRSFL